MNPVMRNMQARHRNATMSPESKPIHKSSKKKPRRPPPPVRNRLMSTPQHLQTFPCAPTQPVAPIDNVNYDDKLTHLSSLFPNIDNSIIMDILLQKRGNVGAATSDLFQLTNPGVEQASPDDLISPPEFGYELPPCYDDLDLSINLYKESLADEFASLPASLNKERQTPKKHNLLRKCNTSLALPMHPYPPPQKEYLKQWKKGEMCWLNVNGRKILIGPLPNYFLRLPKPVYTRSQSATVPTALHSPIYRDPPPLILGPNEEINSTRDGRISPFRLPLELEKLDIVDPEETENQLFADWKLANYLQNIEFMSRVEQNRELFASLKLAANNPDPSGRSAQTPLYSTATLKKLDKGTKKKLTKMARKISRENPV